MRLIVSDKFAELTSQQWGSLEILTEGMKEVPCRYSWIERLNTTSTWQVFVQRPFDFLVL